MRRPFFILGAGLAIVCTALLFLLPEPVVAGAYGMALALLLSLGLGVGGAGWALRA